MQARISVCWQHIGIAVSISIDRELNNDEKSKLYTITTDLVNTLRRNTLLADPKHISETRKEKMDLLECFPNVRIHVKEIANEYSDYLGTPWFLVTTTKGPIKIGWRKRVIMIDWSESDIHFTSTYLFHKEDTTKGERYIHAWGYTKAKQYLETLLA